MKIKYSPIKWNPNSKSNALPDTEIIHINENSISIDSELFDFDELDVEWPDIINQTGGKILEAHRNGELYITVRRFYTRTCHPWDTGDYHEIVW